MSRIRNRSRVNDDEEESNEEKQGESETGCPHCGGDVIESKGERVCKECDTVLDDAVVDRGKEWRSFNSQEESNKSRVGNPITMTMHDKGLTTNIGWRNKDAYGRALSADKRRQMRRLRKWQERSRTKDSGERNLQFALSEIDRMASGLGLPRQVREVASMVYREALNQDLIRGRSIEGVSTAALYVACRMEEIPRSLEELERVSRVKRKEIGRTYRYISKELGLELEPVDPKRYIPRFCSELDLSEAVENKANVIIDVSKEAGLLSGKSPTGFAAAAIYAASLLCNEKRTQKEVAEVANVTEVTIRNRYQEQIKVLGIIVEENDI